MDEDLEPRGSLDLEDITDFTQVRWLLRREDTNSDVRIANRGRRRWEL
jgi:hypothetical protein